MSFLNKNNLDYSKDNILLISNNIIKNKKKYEFIKIEKKCILWKDFLNNGKPVIFKLYKHRGLFNYIRERFLGFRVKREYDALEKLMLEDIPCSKPVSYEYGYSKTYGFYELLVTEEIQNVANLHDIIKKVNGKFKSTIDLTPLFSAIKKMHLKGIFHGHLRPKNILARDNDNKNLQYFFIDMPHSEFFSKSIADKSLALYDLLKLITKIDSCLGIGSCKPFLVSSGYKPNYIKYLYNNSAYSQVLYHSNKKNMIIFAYKIFIAKIMNRYF